MIKNVGRKKIKSKRAEEIKNGKVEKDGCEEGKEGSDIFMRKGRREICGDGGKVDQGGRKEGRRGSNIIKTH